MYLLYWKSSITGATGNGTHPMTKEVGEAVIKENVDKYPFIKYWLVQV